MSAIGQPVGLTTLFIAIFFTLSNCFLKLFFLSKLKSKKNEQKKNQILAKTKLISVELIISIAIQEFYLPEKNYVKEIRKFIESQLTNFGAKYTNIEKIFMNLLKICLII